MAIRRRSRERMAGLVPVRPTTVPEAALEKAPPAVKKFCHGRRYSPHMVEVALRRSRGMISRAARRLGCSTFTVREYIKRYPELEDVLWEVREALMDDVEDSLYQQAVIDRNTAAAIYLAKCFGRARGFIDQPTVNLHAHANAEGLSWLDIMKEVTSQHGGRLPASTTEVVDVTPVTRGQRVPQND